MDTPLSRQGRLFVPAPLSLRSSPGQNSQRNSDVKYGQVDRRGADQRLQRDNDADIHQTYRSDDRRLRTGLANINRRRILRRASAVDDTPRVAVVLFAGDSLQHNSQDAVRRARFGNLSIED